MPDFTMPSVFQDLRSTKIFTKHWNPISPAILKSNPKPGNVKYYVQEYKSRKFCIKLGRESFSFCDAPPPPPPTTTLAYFELCGQHRVELSGLVHLWWKSTNGTRQLIFCNRLKLLLIKIQLQ